MSTASRLSLGVRPAPLARSTASSPRRTGAGRTPLPLPRAPARSRARRGPRTRLRGATGPSLSRTRAPAALCARAAAASGPSQAEGSVDIIKIMMISKAMIFYDVTQAVIGNLHDFFMISDLRFLHTYILEIEYAVSRGFI